jgi:hypothetical protein
MKKTLISLAAASLVASSAFAADKGIDINVGGQAALYYQTVDVDGDINGLFHKDHSIANVGVQLDLGADLGNNFTFGSQLTYLGTSGLEKNLVSGVAQIATTVPSTINAETTNDIALTKLFIAKQIANTTVKIGRQELPMSLSPLAYSEGWNVYKNTFDAIVVINADIPKTTVVAAYVSGGTGSVDLGTTGNLFASTVIGAGAVEGEAYMLTASTTAIPMTTLTGSYYRLKNVLGTNATLVNPHEGLSTDAYWIDAAIASKDLPMGLNFGLQYANLDTNTLKGTEGFGAKVGITPIEALTLGAAYTDVDGGVVSLLNTGTGTETALYTNIVANEQAIALDAKTWMVNASYNTGAYGTIGLAYADTSAGGYNFNNAVTFVDNDMAEFDLTYSVQAGGVDYLVAYVNQDYDTANSDTDIIRIVARYNF